MTWALRGLAAFGAFLVLLAVSVAVATGPIVPGVSAAPASSSPAPTTAAPSGSPETTVVDNSPRPLPTASSSPVPSATFIPVEERPRAVFLGDSITRGATDPALGVVDEFSWFYGLIDDSMGVVRWGGTVAEIGMTSGWMAEQADNALSLSPDILIVLGGTNDITGPVTPDDVIANLESIKVKADAYGIRLAVCTVPPRSDPEVDARAVALNAALKVWAPANGIILLDTARDLRAPGGGWKPGYSGDGVHPTPEAARLMSAAAAETLRSISLGS